MPQSAAHHLFCFGLSYTAQALIAHLRQAMPGQWRFSGTCRSAGGVAAFAAEGIDAQVFDGRGRLADTTLLQAADHVLSSVPPEAEGDPVLRWHGEDLGRHGGLVWAGYLSTTGVYGDHGGGWVDESTAITPSQPRGQLRADAEAAWLNLWQSHGVPVHLFRLAGIYGPGRSALDALREGRAQRVVKPGQVFSRIHVHDIAAVLAASMARRNPGTAYNVADNEPAPPQDVTAYAAGLLQMPPPPEIPFETANLSPMARSFYAENKRVSNRRIREDLGVTLRYPTYREGLRALLPPPSTDAPRG